MDDRRIDLFIVTESPSFQIVLLFFFFLWILWCRYIFTRGGGREGEYIYHYSEISFRIFFFLSSFYFFFRWRKKNVIDNRFFKWQQFFNRREKNQSDGANKLKYERNFIFQLFYMDFVYFLKFYLSWISSVSFSWTKTSVFFFFFFLFLVIYYGYFHNLSKPNIIPLKILVYIHQTYSLFRYPLLFRFSYIYKIKNSMGILNWVASGLRVICIFIKLESARRHALHRHTLIPTTIFLHIFSYTLSKDLTKGLVQVPVCALSEMCFFSSSFFFF